MFSQALNRYVLPHERYAWGDKSYKFYMRYLISILEVYHEHKNEVLIRELDESLIVIFFTTGIYMVGYSYKGKSKFVS